MTDPTPLNRELTEADLIEDPAEWVRERKQRGAELRRRLDEAWERGYTAGAGGCGRG